MAFGPVLSPAALSRIVVFVFMGTLVTTVCRRGEGKEVEGEFRVGLDLRKLLVQRPGTVWKGLDPACQLFSEAEPSVLVSLYNLCDANS